MAPASKRMSAEEKRECLLSLYHATKDVYTEKEVQSLGCKAGISSGAVIPTNDALVDDNLVMKRKVGGQVYFWSFPAKKDRDMLTKLEQLEKDLEVWERKRTQAEAALTSARKGREDDDGSRPAKMQKISSLESEKAAVAAELEVLKENDPAVVESLKKQLRMATEAAHRWTDNVFACKSYLTKKRGMSGKEADQYLRITSAFDYPEDKLAKP
mmetsp:Transcript_25596/g.51103  ORF Transcript_25596/g.51103 Transcript_25596/m.51103 type:complete len:213 (+) Transcript_25596:54-692(+)